MPYKPFRNIETEDILDILQRLVVKDLGPKKAIGQRKAVVEFLALPGIKRFLSKFDLSRQNLFMHYCLLYLKIYQTSCTFEINVTDRYPSRTSIDEDEAENAENEPNDDKPEVKAHLEGCVIAKQAITKGEHIAFLEGWLAGLDDDVDQTFKGETDFSIIHTSRNGNANLLLGPARFVNHDCNPNCSFTRKGQKISLRAIKNIHIGQELTVTYAKNYFGYRNRECRCVTCEIRGVNGFGAPNEYPSEEDSSDTDFLTKLKRRNRKSFRTATEITDSDVPLSPAIPASSAEIVDSESTPQSSRSPSAGAEVVTPATSIEPDPVDIAKCGPPKDVPLKRRLRQREGYCTSEDKLFKFSFEDDDENFTNSREEWKIMGRGLTKEDRELYTFHDYIVHKLSDLHRYKDLQRFYFSAPIDADPDLTLDCVNCGTPFFGPDDRVAPRRLPTRMCPRCHRHAIVFNAYWPSTESLAEKIELLRAWDFTSLKEIGVRGEFVPPDEKKKKSDQNDSSENESESESEVESESENDSDAHAKRRHTLPRLKHRGRPRHQETSDSESDVQVKQRKKKKHSNIPSSLPHVQPRRRGRPKKLSENQEMTPLSDNEKPEIPVLSKRSLRKKTEKLQEEKSYMGTRSRPTRDNHGNPFPRRPLYVVPLNSKMPTCILLPPEEDKDNSLGFPIPMPPPKSGSNRRDTAPEIPKRLLRGTVSLDELATGKSMFDFPYMTTPSLPASSPLLVDGCEPFSVEPPPLPEAPAVKSEEPVPKYNGCRHPKVKSFGLGNTGRVEIYTAPSWKLLQDIQPYR